MKWGRLFIFILGILSADQAQAQAEEARRDRNGEMLMEWIRRDPEPHQRAHQLELFVIQHARGTPSVQFLGDPCFRALRQAAVLELGALLVSWHVSTVIEKNPPKRLFLDVKSGAKELWFTFPKALADHYAQMTKQISPTWMHDQPWLPENYFKQREYRRVLGPGLWMSSPSVDANRHFYLTLDDDFLEMAPDFTVELYSDHFPLGQLIWIGKRNELSKAAKFKLRDVLPVIIENQPKERKELLERLGLKLDSQP